VLALEAAAKHAHDVGMDAIEALDLPDPETFERLEAFLAEHQKEVAAVQEAPIAAAVDIARQIWATPAATLCDIVARAELVAFWGRPLSDLCYHGYDDPHAEKKLVDAIAAVAVEGSTDTALPRFEPPDLLLEHRRLDEAWAQRRQDALHRLREAPGHYELSDHVAAKWRCEKPLLKDVAATRCWADLAICAEFATHSHKTCPPTSAIFSREEDVFFPRRSYAELLLAIMQIADGVWPIDNSEVYWEVTNRPAVEQHREKSRVYHAELMELRKAHLAERA
jgi:hypothetical protein